MLLLPLPPVTPLPSVASFSAYRLHDRRRRPRLRRRLSDANASAAGAEETAAAAKKKKQTKIKSKSASQSHQWRTLVAVVVVLASFLALAFFVVGSLASSDNHLNNLASLRSKMEARREHYARQSAESLQRGDSAQSVQDSTTRRNRYASHVANIDSIVGSRDDRVWRWQDREGGRFTACIQYFL